MAAVGKLDVPGQKWENAEMVHVAEHCTATLVTENPREDAAYILSAWHCMEYYRDLSMTIQFSLPSLGLSRQARLVASGGSMSADWALLKLDHPVPGHQVPALSGLRREHSPAGTKVIMAGFSGDDDVGRGGAILSYDDSCHILSTSRQLVTTDCSAFKGASGGPVILQTSDHYQLLGIISVGDSMSRSMYVPTGVFLAPLRRIVSPGGLVR